MIGSRKVFSGHRSRKHPAQIFDSEGGTRPSKCRDHTRVAFVEKTECSAVARCAPDEFVVKESRAADDQAARSASEVAVEGVARDGIALPNRFKVRRRRARRVNNTLKCPFCSNCGTEQSLECCYSQRRQFERIPIENGI